MSRTCPVGFSDSHDAMNSSAHCCNGFIRSISYYLSHLSPLFGWGHRSGLQQCETSRLFYSHGSFHWLLCPLLTSATRLTPLTVCSLGGPAAVASFNFVFLSSRSVARWRSGHDLPPTPGNLVTGFPYSGNLTQLSYRDAAGLPG